MKTIRPDLLVSKLVAARLGEADAFAAQLATVPRLPELLWFLQSVTHQPGGLDGFVAELLHHYPARFQSLEMLAAGTPDKSGRYTLDQCLELWKSDSESGRCQIFDLSDASDLLEGPAPVPTSADSDLRVNYPEFLNLFIGPETTAADANGRSHLAFALRAGVERFNFDFLKADAECSARSHLARYLFDLCTLPHVTLDPQTYCPDLPALLVEHLDRHAERVFAELADTVITRAVRRRMDFARGQNASVQIVGESRFGKTKSVANWCAARPGQARLVTVPDGNREIEFLRAHADALGIDYTPATLCPVLKDRVEYVLKHAGLMLVLDEAHYLIPSNYHQHTPPRRMNWLRSRAMDAGVPCVFFATPQSYHETLDKYAKVTGYRMEQWVGRIARPLVLSDVIPVEEIIAVARKQFPELSLAQLAELADRAIVSDGFLQSVELAGKMARFMARERGHAQPDLQDVLDACEEMLPAAPRVVSGPPPAAGRVRKQPGNAVATVMPARCNRPVAADLAADLAADSAAEFPLGSNRPTRVESSDLLKV